MTTLNKKSPGSSWHGKAALVDHLSIYLLSGPIWSHVWFVSQEEQPFMLVELYSDR
jgi:hypothetical protein